MLFEDFFLINMQHSVLLCLGSNHEAEPHIMAALGRLSEILDDLRRSSLMPTAPVGMTGPLFLNCAAIGTTALTHDTLLAQIKTIERELGRMPGEKAARRIAIDIDLLRYDDTICHTDDWKRPYIRPLLTELGIRV